MAGGFYLKGGVKVPTRGSGSSTSGGGTSTSTSTKGSYDASKGGFVTESGKVFPTTNPSYVPPGYTSTTSTAGGMTITSGGKVTTYDTSGATGSFIGKALVPGTGKTAQQIANETRAAAIAAGGISKARASQVSYSGYLPQQTPQPQQFKLAPSQPTPSSGALAAQAVNIGASMQFSELGGRNVRVVTKEEYRMNQAALVKSGLNVVAVSPTGQISTPIVRTRGSKGETIEKIYTPAQVQGEPTPYPSLSPLQKTAAVISEVTKSPTTRITSMLPQKAQGYVQAFTPQPKQTYNVASAYVENKLSQVSQIATKKVEGIFASDADKKVAELDKSIEGFTKKAIEQSNQAKIEEKKFLDKWGKYIDKDGMFVGTEEQYAKYQSESNKVNEFVNQANSYIFQAKTYEGERNRMAQYALRGSGKEMYKQFVIGEWQGFLTAPLELARLGLKTIRTPTGAVTETVGGVGTIAGFLMGNQAIRSQVSGFRLAGGLVGATESTMLTSMAAQKLYSKLSKVEGTKLSKDEFNKINREPARYEIQEVGTKTKTNKIGVSSRPGKIGISSKVEGVEGIGSAEKSFSSKGNVALEQKLSSGTAQKFIIRGYDTNGKLMSVETKSISISGDVVSKKVIYVGRDTYVLISESKVNSPIITQKIVRNNKFMGSVDIQSGSDAFGLKRIATGKTRRQTTVPTEEGGIKRTGASAVQRRFELVKTGKSPYEVKSSAITEQIVTKKTSVVKPAKVQGMVLYKDPYGNTLKLKIDQTLKPKIVGKATPEDLISIQTYSNKAEAISALKRLVKVTPRATTTIAREYAQVGKITLVKTKAPTFMESISSKLKALKPKPVERVNYPVSPTNWYKQAGYFQRSVAYGIAKKVGIRTSLWTDIKYTPGKVLADVGLALKRSRLFRDKRGALVPQSQSLPQKLLTDVQKVSLPRLRLGPSKLNIKGVTPQVSYVSPVVTNIGIGASVVSGFLSTSLIAGREVQVPSVSPTARLSEMQISQFKTTQTPQVGNQLMPSVVTETQLQREQIPSVRTSTRGRFNVPRIEPLRTVPTIIPPTPFFGGEEQYQQGYNAYVKERGVLNKVNKVALTLRSALATVAERIDNSPSAEGKVKPVPQKNVRVYDTGNRYFDRNSQKFRTYRIRKGKPSSAQPITVIEKRQYRLDTPGEKQGLKVAKIVKGGFRL